MDSPKERLRKQLREKAPDMAAFVDKMREVFGDVKVVYLKVDDIELGTPGGQNAVHPTDTTPVREVQRRWQEQATAAARSRGSR